MVGVKARSLIGYLVEPWPEGKMVILWEVWEVSEAMPARIHEGEKPPWCKTSRGWITATGEDKRKLFLMEGKERLDTGALKRAIRYTKENWPNLPAQTH